MHDEIDCSPADLATGIDWSTVEGWNDMTPEQEAKLDAVAAKLDHIPEGVWGYPAASGVKDGNPINMRFQVDRNYRNINELIVAHRASTLGTTAFAEIDDDDLDAIAVAVNDELHRRSAG
jgi:hypothetical protein